LKLFSIALDEGFIDELALANRAVARLRIGDTKNAIKDLESSLKLGSHNGDIYFTMAYALYLEGEFDRALAYLNDAIRLQPEDDRSNRYRDAIDRAKRKPEG
jgi:tetratricopeptide (TPR) repeat protein